MDWREQGILLTARQHGETSAIVEVLTEAHGRHAGVVRGGAGKRLGPVLQPGAQLALHWRARLEDHIGTFQVEPVKSRAAAAMSDRLALTGLSSMLALAAFTLPEREPVPAVYHRTVALADNLGATDWPLAYLRWEMALLDEMGFGLDLTRCAVTGSREDLAFVSPRTGRAVSRDGAGDWAPRLLPLPPALLGQGPATPGELRDGFALTGHFLEHRLAPALGDRPIPEARRRFVAALARQSSA